VAQAPDTTAPAAPTRPERAAQIRFDLRPITSDVGGFPRGAWLSALRHALRTAADDTLRYGDAQGAAGLRTALATYLGRSRGVQTTPDRATQLPGCHRRPGRRIARRTLTFPLHPDLPLAL
jgi:GntR family transcriptional regulator/MocR family aminotransferase